MLATVAWVVGALALLAAGDRLLLRLERKGWINYRRRGLNRSGAAFHALELQSIFSPGAEHLAEVRYAQQAERDDSGDPPGDGDADPLIRDTGEPR
jgi:hypothetical protein